MPDRTCSIDDCKKEHLARGMCGMHYRRWRLHGDPRHDRTRIRLLANTDVRGPDECWPWTGPIGEHGYGATSLKRRNMLASRAVYITFVGDPGDLSVDHLCHKPEECPGGSTCPHRRCVNPAHLGLATRVDNAMRGNSIWAQNARKTHCKRGHEFTPENTRIDEKGFRQCRTCERVKKRVGRRPDLKTHCPHGHEYTPENIYVDPRGYINCRTCNRDRSRERMRLRRSGRQG